MQSFIFALLLAGVSGVTVLAFKHPNGYAKLFPYMLAGASFLFVGMTIWHTAVELTWHRLNEFVSEDVFTTAEGRKSTLSVAYGWVVFWYLAASVFLWVNRKLPPFLKVTDPVEHDATESDSQ